MMIKFDFVTNSSSSSFIVAFDKRITLKECKQKIMFIEKARCAYNDGKSQKPKKLKEKDEEIIERILGEIASESAYIGYREEQRIKDSFLVKYNVEDIRDLDPDIKSLYFRTLDQQLCERHLTKFMNFWRSGVVGKYIYFFSYSDNNGRFGSEMEHGDTFENFSHVSISHH